MRDFNNFSGNLLKLAGMNRKHFWAALLVSLYAGHIAKAQTWSLSPSIDSNTSSGPIATLSIIFPSRDVGYICGAVFGQRSPRQDTAWWEAVHKFHTTDGGITWHRFLVTSKDNT